MSSPLRWYAEYDHDRKRGAEAEAELDALEAVADAGKEVLRAMREHGQIGNRTMDCLAASIACLADARGSHE